MPMTVITVKNVPKSLRGDLTKWTQEIATGVYIGNFNVKVREELWERIKDNIGDGEATISFTYRNEIGYSFFTHNSNRKQENFDGLPLVRYLDVKNQNEDGVSKYGFSNAAKFSKSRKYASLKPKVSNNRLGYVAIDIETDGLNENINKIIEIGAVKNYKGKLEFFNELIYVETALPDEIVKLTGIRSKDLREHGKNIKEVLVEFKKFIGNSILLGYGVDFDIRFINVALKNQGLEPLNNKVYDLLKFVKKEKKFLQNYKFQMVLKAYSIEKIVPHRALQDAELVYELSQKVNKFLNLIK